jgi:hypothetical protein
LRLSQTRRFVPDMMALLCDCSTTAQRKSPPPEITTAALAA